MGVQIYILQFTLLTWWTHINESGYKAERGQQGQYDALMILDTLAYFHASSG